MIQKREINTDVLVIGSGGAGALAAIKAMAEGAKVLVVTKGPFPSGNTSVARAGYGVALGYADPRDNPDVHFKDIIKTGNGLNNQKVVRAWVKEIVEITKEMDSWGIELVRENGKLHQKGEGANATYPRGVHHHDTTGPVIMKCLKQKCKEVEVQSLDHTIIGGLFKQDGAISGAWGIQYQNGEFIFINARAVVLATGGLGHLFPISDSVKGITGEGYTLALRAGAELVDMEMFDFQVTTCYPEKMKGYACHAGGLISFGGARLYNGSGERFMKKYFPDSGEKGRTRSELSRAIGLEIYEGRGTPHGGIFLDTTDITREKQETYFPVVWKAFANAGVDLNYQMMEIVPNAHTFLGGVRINEKGSSNVPGLFAAGEAAGGAQGATRMGGAALSAILALGPIAGRNAALYVKSLGKNSSINDQQLQQVQSRIDSMLSRKDGIKPKELKKKVQALAYKYLNVVREEQGLKKALEELKQLEKNEMPLISTWGESQKEKALNLCEAIEVDGQLELAQVIGMAALCRQESRGGHYRKDYPSENNNEWLKNIVFKKENGVISYHTEPVVKE